MQRYRHHWIWCFIFLKYTFHLFFSNTYFNVSFLFSIVVVFFKLFHTLMLSLTGYSSPTVKCQTVSRRSVLSSLSQHSDSDIMGWMRSVSVSYGQYQHLLVVCLESRRCCCCSTGGTTTDLSCAQHSHSCTGHQSTAHRSAGCRVWAVDQDLGGLTGWRSVLCSVWEVRGIIDCINWWPWFPGSTLSLYVCVCLCASCWHRWLWSSDKHPGHGDLHQEWTIL